MVRNCLSAFMIGALYLDWKFGIRISSTVGINKALMCWFCCIDTVPPSLTSVLIWWEICSTDCVGLHGFFVAHQQEIWTLWRIYALSLKYWSVSSHLASLGKQSEGDMNNLWWLMHSWNQKFQHSDNHSWSLTGVDLTNSLSKCSFSDFSPAMVASKLTILAISRCTSVGGRNFPS